MFQSFDSYCTKFTESEKQHFINEMRTKLAKLSNDVVPVEIDPQYERANLDQFQLFQKKNYYIYQLSKQIVDILFATKCDAYVYGGFIRDNILHGYMANKFYEENDDYDASEVFERYNDPKVDSVTSFRTLVPKDIDMRFASHMDYNTFLAKLKSEGYHVNAFVNDTDSDKYKTPKKNGDEKEQDDEFRFKLEVKSNETLQKLKLRNIRFLDSEYATTIVKLDVTITDKKTRCDFLCNSIRMSRHGFSHGLTVFFESVKTLLMEKKHDLALMDIIENQIHNMEAVILCCLNIPVPDIHRMIKMASKGWKIKLENFNQHSYCSQITAGADDEDLCIICHEKFEKVKIVPGVHTLLNGVKFSCCSASYHCHCLMELLQKDTAHTVVSRDKSYVSYKCIQCAQSKMSFYKDKMIEFLHEFNKVLYIIMGSDES